MADSTEEPSTSATTRGAEGSSSTYTESDDRQQRRNEKRAQRQAEARERRLQKMQAVVNNTPFKTGWEVKEASAELAEERVWMVDVIPPRDQFVNDECLNMLTPEELKLHNWKKTQRRIDTRFKCISMDANQRTLRRDRPLKKLCSPGVANNIEQGTFQSKHVSCLISTRFPCPVYSDEPLPDTGKRSGLDLRCIRHEMFLKAFQGDIKGIAGRRLLSLGPSCSRHVEKFCNENPEILNSASCQSKSWTSDPNGRIDISYPDERNYKKEEDQLRKGAIQPLLDEMRFQFLNLRQDGCNYVCSVTDGLQPTIHLISPDKYTRILCVTVLKASEVRNGLAMRYMSLIGMRKLRPQEIAICVAKAAEWNLNKSAIVDGDFVYEVVLGESGEGENFYETYGCNPLGLNYFSSVVRYPEELDDDHNDRFYSLVAKWYTTASTQKGQIYLKDEADVGYAEQILNGCSVHVRISDKLKEGGSRVLTGDWFRQSDNFSHDPLVLERLTRKILELNDIELDRVVIGRYNYQPPLNDANIKARLNWRIGRSAVNDNIWTGYEPKNELDWYIYRQNLFRESRRQRELERFDETVEDPNSGNEERLEWTVELGPARDLDEHTAERKAVVKFKRERFGKGIIDYVLPLVPDWQFLTLAAPTHKDRQGARFYPVYTVRFTIPRSIRTVCHKALEKLDATYRRNSSYDSSRDSWWVRLRDYKYEDALVVEGWPAERVEMVADEARLILKGRVVDCSDDGSDKSPARLLYGCGLAFVNNIQRQNSTDLLMSVDRLNEKITMWGDKTKCCAVAKVLQLYPKQSRQYRIKAEISISEPRFLPVFREVLVFNGEEAVGKAVGGAKVQFRKPDRLLFKGSVDQYEKLQEILDEEHAKLIALTRRRRGISFEDLDVASLLPKECPVCLMPAHGSFSLEYCGHAYCLTCLTKMIRVAIESKQVPIKCCAEGCDQLVALKDIMELVFDKPSRELPSAFKDRLQPLWKATHEMAVMQSQELTFCSKADCRAVINRMERNPGNTYTCTGCGGELCAGCFNPPHPDWNCRDEMAYRGNVELSLQGYLTSGSRRHDVKKCPNTSCKAVIEKDYGCNHMHCRVCNVHFCWRCMFMADSAPGIYKHMTEEHGGTGGEWAFLDDQQENMENINLAVPPGLEHRVHQMVRDMDRDLHDRRGELIMIDGHPVFVD